MEAARQIRDAVAQVASLREAVRSDPGLLDALAQVKRTQARRFGATYADLPAGPSANAARFFLEELYSDKDYAERDAQFARIAGAIERFFPAQVVQTAVTLARLHALTEDLDQSMARAWLGTSGTRAQRYVAAWRAVGRRTERERQLSVVLGIGDEMTQLTRKPGLRTLLRMMRAPATAAGLDSLQRFLEQGFDTFAAMARTAGGAQQFLATIAARETAWIAALFDADLVACETKLGQALGEAP